MGKIINSKSKKLGSAQVLRLLARLSLYYVIFFAAIWAVYTFFPGFKAFSPFGGVEELFQDSGPESFELISTFTSIRADAVATAFRLFFAILTSLFVMLPVSWVYLQSRVPTRLDQSLVQTMLILPIGVAGVVTIVQHSLALAFSLAGIVAAVRFRNTLKNTGDALFIFTAIAVGLAAGVGALEIGIVATFAFNYIFLLLWDLDYGAENAEKYMRASDDEEKDIKPDQTPSKNQK